MKRSKVPGVGTLGTVFFHTRNTVASPRKMKNPPLSVMAESIALDRL